MCLVDGLDDDHLANMAIWTAESTLFQVREPVLLVGTIFVTASCTLRVSGKQFTTALEMDRPMSIGQKAIVTNSWEAAGQCVEEEATDEFTCG